MKNGKLQNDFDFYRKAEPHRKGYCKPIKLVFSKYAKTMKFAELDDIVAIYPTSHVVKSKLSRNIVLIVIQGSFFNDL